MLKKAIITIALFLVLQSTSHHAFALDVYQTVDLSNPGKHPYLSNHLRAGDTITIKLVGGEFSEPQADSVIYSSTKKKRRIRVELDPMYYIAEPGGEYSPCSGKTVTVLGSDEAGNRGGSDSRSFAVEMNQKPTPSSGTSGEKQKFTCIQKTFRVIGNYGTYTVLDIVEISDDGGRRTESTYMNVVMVESSSGISLSFAGGFFISGLTDPVYYSEGANDTIRRNKSAEDEVALGVAFFMHTCNETWTKAGAWKLRPTCASLGLGLSDQSGELSFFPGLTWTLGREFYLTAGAHYAEVNTLPKGLKVGDQLTSANDLNTLGSKFDVSYFLSISYKFLGTGAKEAINVRFSPSE